MKYRYLVFAYDYYYPAGGMDDCICKTNEILSVKHEFRSAEKTYQSVEIYDCESGETYYTIEQFINGISP